MTDSNQNRDFDPEGLTEDEIAILEGKDVENPVTDIPPEPEKETEAKAETDLEKDNAEDGDEPVNPAANPDRPDGYVPHQALKAEREKARKAEQELAENRRLVAQIAEKLAEQRSQVNQQAEPEAPAMPSADEDPIGAIQYLMKKLEGVEQQSQAQQEAQAQEQAWTRFEQDVNREFSQAAQSDPDVAEAMQFLNHAIALEYQKVYANSGVPWQQFQRDMIRQHSAYARNNGIPIGEYIKHVAESRFWRPGILKNAQQQPQAGNPDMAKASAKIDAIAAAQDANKTLGKGTSGGGGEITLETLANMSGEELEILAGRNPELFAKFGVSA